MSLITFSHGIQARAPRFHRWAVWPLAWFALLEMGLSWITGSMPLFWKWLGMDPPF